LRLKSRVLSPTRKARRIFRWETILIVRVDTPARRDTVPVIVCPARHYGQVGLKQISLTGLTSAGSDVKMK
jgi:hypothetical protein